MPQLLIHDTRSVGFLTGAVLTRVLRRSGIRIVPYFDPVKTRHAQEFWPTIAPTLELKGFSRVILCCMTFDDVHPEPCRLQLQRFQEETGRPPLIFSHRWPDKYEDAGYQVFVPPFDVLEEWPSELEPVDRELLRLSLIISRQADPKLVGSDDFAFADRLSTAMWKEPNQYWDNLTCNPAAALDSVRLDTELSSAASLSEKGTCEVANEKCALFNVNPIVRGHAEKTVEALLTEHGNPPIGIGIRRDERDVRVHLVRPWQADLPSIEYLLERYSREFDLPESEHWRGPQDAKTLRFKYAGLNGADLPLLKSHLIKFAEFAYDIRTGERRPVAGLARLIHRSATDALLKLDLTRTHTKPVAPTLAFDPLRLRILMDRSNRTGEFRSTLVVRLVASSPDAAAFLFKYEAHNLMKLERLLEGVLIGLGAQRSTWLGSLRIPTRLRVDVELGNNVLNRLGDALTSALEVSTISIGDAVDAGVLAKKSSIYTALCQYCPDEQKRWMLLFRASDTIGPSVPYALAVGALAESLGTLNGKHMDVLDLFSGSGLAARAVLTKQESWHVYCVDSAITAAQAGLASEHNVFWLRTDVGQVVAGEDGLLNRAFDIVALDPPHNLLFELLFDRRYGSSSLFDRVTALAPWLVVYQGHASQVGKAVALRYALEVHFQRVTLWHIGPEVVTVAGPTEWRGHIFDDILKRAADSLKYDCKKYDLPFSG